MPKDRGKSPENFDFPMSRIYRTYSSDTVDATKKNLKQVPKPETIKVAGMTLFNIQAGDRIDENNGQQLEKNLNELFSPLKQTGAPTETPPVVKPAPADREPKKILPPWRSDPEPGVGIATDPYRRTRAQISDVGHDLTIHKQQRREDLGLPAKKLSFKEMLAPLTREDIADLTKLGFDVAKIRRGTPSYEKMLLALKKSRKT